MSKKTAKKQHTINIQIDSLALLSFKLYEIWIQKNAPKTISQEKFRQEAEDIFIFITKYVQAIDFHKRKDTGSGDIQFHITYKPELSRSEIDSLNEVFTRYYMYSEPLRLICEDIIKRKVKEKLHKQPRNLLKTISKTIGTTTDKPNLFTIPIQTETSEGAIAQERELISKNTAALGLYFMEQYQKLNNTPVVIENLNELAELFNCNNYRMKVYLLYLGGYVYPMVDIDTHTKELVISNEQLFKIEFRYNPDKLKSKYAVENKKVIGVERIGNNVLSFIKNEEIDRIVITPNPKFIEALEGKGLGNILAVNDTLVGLVLELSDIATKILAYSSSNKPNWKIKEDNLVKHLGLDKQIKRQGKPRVRATIIKGLQELKEKGHINNYLYEEETEMYSYEYSDKYFKYKSNKKEKNT